MTTNMSDPAYELSDINKSKKRFVRQANDISGETSPTDLPDVVVVDGSAPAGAASPGASPVDKYRIVFSILLLHGIGTLMPWNMFITSRDYFLDYKLAPVNGTTSDPDLDNIRKNFLSYIGLAAQLPNVIFNGMNLLINFSPGNMRLRVNSALIVEAIIFIVTIILAIIDTATWQINFFRITIALVVLLNMASGLYQNCVFGMGAIFPGSYTNAIMIGSNASGTFTSVVDLLSKWLAPAPQQAAIYYFFTALFVILICIISYNGLPYNMFYKHYESKSHSDPDKTSPSTSDGGADDSRARLSLDDPTKNKQEDDGIPATLREAVEAMVPRPEIVQENSFKSELIKKWNVFKVCWPQCLNVFFTFYVTLALFPTVVTNVKQKQNFISEKYFSSVAGFLTFNLFALLGNILSGWTTWPGKNHLGKLVLIRCIFVPFFLYCNFNPSSRTWPVLIESDIIYVAGNILFALSSGYLSSLCMMFASSELSAEDCSVAGMLAAFFLVFGIFTGINSSFLMTAVVEL